MESDNRSMNIEGNFINRQKNLNAQLDAIEKSLNKHNNHTDSRVPRLEDLSTGSRYKKKIRGYRGQQSIFKRPEGPAPRTKVSVIPDYRKNPKKWTCYNLDDVSDMSNESNSQAAFAFLHELEQRKEKDDKKHKLLEVRDKQNIADNEMEVNTEEDENCCSIISFKKPIKRKESSSKPKLEFKSSKIVMPEYEIGTKKAAIKKSLQRPFSEKIDKSKEIKLDHLLNYDDGEE